MGIKNYIIFYLTLSLFILVVIIALIYYAIKYIDTHMSKVDKFNNTKLYLAFYTCFYGSNNNNAFRIPEIPSTNYDCYYFTNNKDIMKELENTKWIGIYDNKPVTDDLIESCMYGKYVKGLPCHNSILQKYDYTCFLDSKLDKVSETFVENMIDKYFVKESYALLLREHVFLKGYIWDEYNESMKQERYRKESARYYAYIQKQLSKGLKETTSYHCQCGFLIRNMKHPVINQINQKWYDEIQECGIQDQISFFFVKQYFDQHILPFTEIPFI